MLTFYRGDSINTKVLKSHAAQENGYAFSQDLLDSGDIDQLMIYHANDSTNPLSPFVGMSSDRRVADYFAGEDGYIYELLIPSSRVTRNPHNNVFIPGGILENEWLARNYINPNYIKSVTKKSNME